MGGATWIRSVVFERPLLPLPTGLVSDRLQERGYAPLGGGRGGRCPRRTATISRAADCAYCAATRGQPRSPSRFGAQRTVSQARDFVLAELEVEGIIRAESDRDSQRHRVWLRRGGVRGQNLFPLCEMFLSIFGKSRSLELRQSPGEAGSGGVKGAEARHGLGPTGAARCGRGSYHHGQPRGERKIFGASAKVGVGRGLGGAPPTPPHHPVPSGQMRTVAEVPEFGRERAREEFC
jgi:hypothetical protein